MSRIRRFWMLAALMLLAFTSQAQTSEVWLTTGSQSAQLAQQGSLTFGANSGSSTTININEGSTFQTIDGYGFTLTQGSAKVITNMSASAQSNLLNELFNTSSGIGISVIRIGIGATDLSDYAYSYRDGASFSLSGPDLTYTIPILKKIIAINPNIKVLATPWSAPMWMKTSGSFVGGTLKAENYESYGQYWLDYMNAMKAQGINIWAVTPQNEPLNGHNNPSMTLTKENELGLINSYIGPKLRGARFNCKIICYDHNCDNTEHPIYVANNSAYVDGSAFHLYGGNISAMTTVKNATNKNVYFTEQYTGANGSFSGDLVWHTQNVTIGSANNWSRTALEWNLANDQNYGPHTSGGCTDCKGGVTINGSSVTRNVGYYILAHFSKFVKPNAVRIGASSNHGNLHTTAFKNSDGSKVVEVLNNSGGSITFRVVWNNSSFTYTLQGSSVVTFKWSGNGGGGGNGAPIGSVITLRGNNNMFVSGENGTTAMMCNRATAGTWEQFAVVDAGNGKIGLRSMGKFVSSENGATSGMTCNRATIGGSGSWEHFDWIVNADGKISLRGNNGQYVTSSNGASSMKCNSAAISGWEAFTYTVVGTARERTEMSTEDNINEKLVDVYPNPVRDGKINVMINGQENMALVTITNSEGKMVTQRTVKDTETELELDKNLKPGIYYVQIKKGASKTIRRIVVE
ncbi:glycoside hydrolase family 30 beta sandwich domain-containing protein [Pseudochryseolinea flava]|uniref:glycoside hydrolase family 30 beta sandwich domain-containing protein n=1 Tax=Pseudochryseolinea flava TaxID=2059302 RepID=UPI001C86F16B|nr:glycoside hydrolase family 30 beta sandwich domain-containing protein [Pseudochryseolinea flava]